MTRRRLFSWSLFWLGSATTSLAMTIGCSSTPTTATGCLSGETSACTCAGGQSGVEECGSPVCVCGGEDSGGAANTDASIQDSAPIDTPGDATHLDEKPPPTTVYAECAVQGSFGWPCGATMSGPDPTECTDPNFPDCFVGGQGSWCTASCASFGVCPGPDQDGGDAGCTPTACNARGYCK